MASIDDTVTRYSSVSHELYEDDQEEAVVCLLAINICHKLTANMMARRYILFCVCRTGNMCVPTTIAGALARSRLAVVGGVSFSRRAVHAANGELREN